MAVNMEITDARSAVSDSEDLVFSIFNHFSLQQRAMASTACKLWRDVATAPEFWVDIDFSLYPTLGHAQVRQQGGSTPCDCILPSYVAFCCLAHWQLERLAI